MFFKVGVLKNFANFANFLLCWSLFSIKFQVSGLQPYRKRDPARLLFCEVYQIFKNTFFYRTPSVSAFESKTLPLKIFDMTHFILLVSVYTPWKHQNTSDVLMFFRGYEKRPLACVALIIFFYSIVKCNSATISGNFLTLKQFWCW